MAILQVSSLLLKSIKIAGDPRFSLRMQLPSKEEIRKRYNITEEDFAILAEDKLPDKTSLLKESASLENLGFWEKYSVWAKRSIIGGFITAIIFIGELRGGLE